MIKIQNNTSQPPVDEYARQLEFVFRRLTHNSSLPLTVKSLSLNNVEELLCDKVAGHPCKFLRSDPFGKEDASFSNESEEIKDMGKVENKIRSDLGPGFDFDEKKLKSRDLKGVSESVIAQIENRAVKDKVPGAVVDGSLNWEEFNYWFTKVEKLKTEYFIDKTSPSKDGASCPVPPKKTSSK